MSSPKAKAALQRLGHGIRGARLRRNFAIEELAVRAGASRSTVGRVERGAPGVSIGTLADVLVALGLIERLADLIDIRKDNLGLALTSERLPQRGRNVETALRRQKARQDRDGAASDVDPDGVAF